MKLSKQSLFFAVGIGVVALPPGGIGSRGGRGAAPPPPSYGTNAVEHYLSEEEMTYIRPGLNVTVNSVTVPADLHPVVDFSLSDDLDQPLDRAGKVTPGAISVSFILAWWDPVERQYTSYTTRQDTSLPTSPHPNVTVTQAGADANGTFDDLAIGRATYRFNTVLPANFDQSKTTTLGIYATRDLTAILNKNYYANVEHDFRPDGKAVTEKWDMIPAAACNSCHDPLSAHGGARQDVRLCVLCHTPQSVNPDTGNTVDFKVMIHKIHDGASLPSVIAGTPYQIINRFGVSDFSTVVFPQDIRNCTTCHAAPATQALNYATFPARAPCQSCHDDVNFATGLNHPGGVQTNDAACASCHQPQGDLEFDASVIGAHTVPTKSTQLQGLGVKIVSVTNTAPGDHPTVTFQVSNGDGSAVAPSTLGSNLNLILGGPTVEYSLAAPFRESAGGAAFDGTTATYTFKAAIPADATGSWAVAAEARRTVTLNPGTRNSMTVTEGAINPVTYVAVTDATPEPRREVVSIDKCNVCHSQLALHGGQRFVTKMCVICHNPNANDSSQRPAADDPPESIQFARLIHRIHTGEDLTQDFTIFGFNGSVNNFNGVRFPGDRRDCEKCHIAGSEELPLPLTNLPVATPRDYYTPMQPTAAACLGCHDSRDAAAHAFVMTAPFGEACASCHAPDDDFAVDKVHAR